MISLVGSIVSLVEKIGGEFVGLDNKFNIGIISGGFGNLGELDSEFVDRLDGEFGGLIGGRGDELDGLAGEGLNNKRSSKYTGEFIFGELGELVINLGGKLAGGEFGGELTKEFGSIGAGVLPLLSRAFVFYAFLVLPSLFHALLSNTLDFYIFDRVYGVLSGSCGRKISAWSLENAPPEFHHVFIVILGEDWCRGGWDNWGNWC
jgi:hypothetical protein